MAEYIERDPLIEICDNQGHADIDDILSVPAADVAEVRHGRWRWCGCDKYNDCYECSGCGKIAMDNSNYCPNCGAKMDLEDNQ